MASSFCLDNETIYEVVITTLSEVDEIAKTLEVPIELEEDFLGLVEKANRALSNLSEQMLGQCQMAGAEGDLPSFDSPRFKNGKTEDMAYALQAVAHEIRNPLTAVGGFARRLAKTVDPSSDEWKYVEVILKETARLELALEVATKGFKA